MGLIVLDTSILVYATGVEHPLRAPCRDLITAIADGTLHASTTPEVALGLRLHEETEELGSQQRVPVRAERVEGGLGFAGRNINNVTAPGG